MTTAIDFSYARPSPDEIASVGASGVLVYTGPARPDASYLVAMRARGLTVCMVQESAPNRSQGGYWAGQADALYADQRADEVGYPVTASICYVVSDGNAGDPSSGGAQIAAYGQGVADTSRRPFFFYGNNYACSNAVSGAGGRALGTWIPSSWGIGSLLTQEANLASPLSATDLNYVHASYRPWGQDAPPAPKPAPAHLEDQMIYVGPLQGRIGNVAWLVAGHLILGQWSDDDGGPGFGGPKKMVDWNAQTGHHFEVKFLDATMMQALHDGRSVV